MASKCFKKDIVDILLRYREDLIAVLAQTQTDSKAFATNLIRNRVIAGHVKEQFDSLDHDHLESKLLFRYLLQKVNDKIRDDVNVFQLFLRVLAGLGGNGKQVCGIISKEVDRCMSGEEAGVVQDSDKPACAYLTEEDIQCLTEILADVSDKWDKIGIVLGLPRAMRKDCKGDDSISSLYNILCEWITYKPDQANLKTLRNKLASRLVGEGRIAMDLEDKFLEVQQPESTLVSKRPRLSSALSIELQSSSTEVADGKSTLLEVQVGPSDSVSYQWMKGDQPLVESEDYSDVCRNILFISHASQGREGKYVCYISEDGEKDCSDEINLTVNVSPAKQHLLNLYSKYKEVPSDSLLPVGTSGFINLALIRSSKFCTKAHDYSITGSADDVIADKEVTYEDIFYGYKSGTLVLVEGRPGSGKTTFVKKIAIDWHKGDMLKGAKMTFFIPLRLLKINEVEESLADILCQLYYNEKKSLVTEEMSSIEKSDGEGVCFIIDGLDEYHPQDESKSIIYKLLYKTYLPQSMVIVSSRPLATINLKQKAPISESLEVVGFSKENVLKYISSFPFPNALGLNKGSCNYEAKLKQYLDSHANVLNICYLPVHAVMICSLYGDGMIDIPTTETHIYKDFVRFAILRHCRQIKKSVCLSSLYDLRGEEKESFERLCILAFHMTINGEHVLSQSEAPTGSAQTSFFGLVTVDLIMEMSSLGIKHTLSFLHITLQEFLAAFHLAQLERKEQIKLVRENSYKPYLFNVWKFFCGLVMFTEEDFKEVLNYSLLSLDENDKLLAAVRCAFESQQNDACSALMKLSNGIVLESRLKASDITALCYVISASEPTNFIRTICLVHHCTDEDGVRRLLLSLGRFKNIFLDCLTISDVGLGSVGAMALAKTSQCIRCLNKLDLSNNKLQYSDTKEFIQNIECSCKISHIDLSHNYIDDDIVKEKKLFGRLESLNLSYNKLSLEAVMDLFSGLKESLQSLYLEGNSSISHEEVQTLANKITCYDRLNLLHLTLKKVDDIKRLKPVGCINFFLNKKRRSSFSGFESHPDVKAFNESFCVHLHHLERWPPKRHSSRNSVQRINIVLN